jgi:uncharacterized membrane protein YqjE
MTIVTNLKTVKLIKIATIIIFLAITYTGGTLTLSNILWIIVGMVASFIDLFCVECGNYFETVLNLILNCFVLSSFYLIFSKKWFLILGSIIVQFIHLSITFSNENLKYTYYIIPTLIYLILCLILIYYTISKSQKDSLQ